MQPLMPLVTIKDKFQVTIPGRVRAQVPLAVGDVLEATVEHGTIVLRPNAVVDRVELARQVERVLAETEVASEDADRSDDELLEAAVAEVAKARRARRSAKG